MSEAASLPIGLGAAGVAGLLLSTGTLLQALDARQVPHRHGLRLSLIGRLLRRPRWVAGTIIGFVAFPFQLIALAHAPLVIVQPISAAGLLLVKGFSDAIARHSRAVAGGYLAAAAVSTSVSILSQMTAFQRHRAIEVLPLTYAIPIFLPAALGLFLLREHWSTAAYGGGAFAMGAVLLVVGTGAVARSRSVVDISERASR